MGRLCIAGALTGLLLAWAGAAVADVFTVELSDKWIGYVEHRGGVVYQRTDFGTSGSGVIDPVLALKSNEWEIWGYNNDEKNPESPHVDKTKTRSFTLDEVPLVTIAGDLYRELLLDANQAQGAIDLTELELYTVDNAPDITTLIDLRAQGTLVHSMDGGGDDGTVRLDGGGSGKADMFLYVPDAAFTVFGAEGTTNVYVYCRFTGNDDGFEEWAVLNEGHWNPELYDLKIVQFEDVDENGQLDSGESLLPDWDFDVLGPQGAPQSFTTGADGTITLKNLAPGQYRVTGDGKNGWKHTTLNPQNHDIESVGLDVAYFGVSHGAPMSDLVPEPPALGLVALALLGLRKRH